MKLLSITHYSGFLGANRSLLHLLEGLRREKEVTVEVWCPSEGAFTAVLRERGIAYKVLPFANGGYTLRSLGLWLFPFKWLYMWLKMSDFEAEMRQFAPDIIHSNSSLVFLGALLSRRTGVPNIWHIREFGWSDYQVIFPLGAAYSAKMHRSTAAFIAISAAIRQRVLANISDTPPVFTIFNGIGTAAALTKMATETQEKTEITHTNFLIIGLLHPSKNQLQALSAFRLAFRKNNALRLTIVGEGRKFYALRLKFLVKLWDLSDVVRFTGYLADPSEAYANADCVLMCSANEGMGRVTAEAMVRAKPVIGCNSGATPELIADGENGFLYNGTTSDLAEKMLFVHKNKEKTAEIAKKAHLSALNRFTDEQYVAACANVFQTVLEKKKQ